MINTVLQLEVEIHKEVKQMTDTLLLNRVIDLNNSIVRQLCELVGCIEIDRKLK